MMLAMQTNKGLGIVLGCIVAAAFGCSPPGDQRFSTLRSFETSSSNTLSLSADSDRRSYALDEDVWMDLWLTNQTHDPIYVSSHFSPGHGGSITFVVRDLTTNRSLPPREGFIAEPSYPPPAPTDLVRLGPQNYLGSGGHFSMDELNIKTPGRYGIEFVYRPPIRKQDIAAREQLVWTDQSGTIRAEAVEILVE